MEDRASTDLDGILFTPVETTERLALLTREDASDVLDSTAGRQPGETA
ncbi:hypothetical protein ABTX34_14630 [Streptomyces sp. NPDC096538]|nr:MULTISPECIES: hypothetical protein [unclassified Streptomyces]MDU0300078.1 hypothetical protein [Streptomyces sp. PAL114]